MVGWIRSSNKSSNMAFWGRMIEWEGSFKAWNNLQTLTSRFQWPRKNLILKYAPYKGIQWTPLKNANNSCLAQKALWSYFSFCQRLIMTNCSAFLHSANWSTFVFHACSLPIDALHFQYTHQQTVILSTSLSFEMTVFQEWNINAPSKTKDQSLKLIWLTIEFDKGVNKIIFGGPTW